MSFHQREDIKLCGYQEYVLTNVAYREQEGNGEQEAEVSTVFDNRRVCLALGLHCGHDS